MIKDIKLFKQTLDVFRNRLKTYLANEEHLLEERWATYCEACKCSIISGYTDYYSNTILDAHDFTYHDDLCIDRYQPITFINFIECLSDDESYTKEEIKNIKEDILQNANSWEGVSYDD